MSAQIYVKMLGIYIHSSKIKF